MGHHLLLFFATPKGGGRPLHISRYLFIDGRLASFLFAVDIQAALISLIIFFSGHKNVPQKQICLCFAMRNARKKVNKLAMNSLLLLCCPAFAFWIPVLFGTVSEATMNPPEITLQWFVPGGKRKKCCEDCEANKCLECYCSVWI